MTLHTPTLQKWKGLLAEDKSFIVPNALNIHAGFLLLNSLTFRDIVNAPSGVEALDNSLTLSSLEVTMYESSNEFLC